MHWNNRFLLRGFAASRETIPDLGRAPIRFLVHAKTRSREGRGGKSRPLTMTLAKFANATGTRLWVSFERAGA